MEIETGRQLAEGDEVTIERQEPPFELLEYERAFLKFTREALEGLSLAKDPVLRGMRKGRPERTYVGRNSMRQGEVHEAPIMPVRSEFSITAAEILDADPAVLGKKLDEMAEGYLASLMPQVFEALGAASQAAGTNVDSGGQPLSVDKFIELLEKMEIGFDDSGQHQLQLVTGSDVKFPTLSTDDERRIDEVISRKRQEFFTKRRRRQLPRHPLGN